MASTENVSVRVVWRIWGKNIQASPTASNVLINGVRVKITISFYSAAILASDMPAVFRLFARPDHGIQYYLRQIHSG